jgi:DNA-binding NarL/FixJ family response regulator
MGEKFQRLKTIVVEDSTRMQQIVADSVEAIPGLQLVAVVDNASDAVVAIEGNGPDVVILDLVLRAGRGIDVLKELRLRAPNCHAIVFTAYDDEQYRERSMSAGAERFFSKNRQHRELIQCLRDLGEEAHVSFWDNPPDQAP